MTVSADREEVAAADRRTRFAPRDELAAAAARADSSAFAVAALDLAGVVRAWSPGAERAFGWPAEVAVGNALPTVPPDQRDRFARLLAEVAGGTAVTELPAEWRRRDGSPVEVRLSLAPLADAAGALTGVALGARSLVRNGVDMRQLEAYARDVRESFLRERRRARALEASYLATVEALAAAVTAKDGYTGEHIHRVHDLGLLLARTVCPDEAGDPQLAYGFMLHDIGKLSVPDAILLKPGPLDPGEMAVIRCHPDEGVEILRAVPFLDRALDVVRHHHERWDGFGYPTGLAGEAIPRWARVFAVIDTLDAMTSDRPYRTALPLDVALAEIAAGAGTQFDPACVEALLGLDRSALVRRLA